MRLRQRLFCTYLALSLLPMLLFLGTSYLILREKELDKLHYACLASVESAAANVESMFERLQALSQTLANATWVQKVAYMQSETVDISRFNAMERNEAVKTLQSNVHAAEAVLMAVAFPRQNYALSSFYIHTLNAFLSVDARFVNAQSEAWHEQIRRNNGTGLSEPGTLTFLSYIRPCVGISVSIPLASSNRASAKLIAYFDMRTIQRRMRMPLYEGALHLLAETPAGSVVYASDLDVETAYTAKQGKWGFWKDGKTLQAQKASSPTGWTFRAFLSKSYLNARLLPLRMGLMALTLALVLMCVGGAWLLAKRRSAPLLRLRQLLSTPESNRKTRGETVYAVLENVMEGILSERSQQNRLLRQFRPKLREHYLRRLLEEEPSALHEENLALVGIAFPYAHTRCLVAGPEGKAAQSLADALRAYALQLDIAEYSLEYQGNEVLILNYNDEACIGRFYQIMTASSAEHADQYQAWVGVGRCGQVRHSYREALRALERRPADCQNIWLWFDEAQEFSPFLTPETENKLLNCIRAGETASAQALVEEILCGNGLSVLDAQYLCLNVCFLLSRTLTEMGNQGLACSLFDEFKTLPTLPALLAHIKPLVEQVSARCAQAAADQNPAPRYAEINGYIQEHLYESTLSLTTVADHFGISGSYISRLIKEHQQISYLDYVNRLRIAKAKQLLLNTGRDINEICMLVGYDNDITFRRVFKKLETITPSQYRVIARINHR